MEAKDYTLLMSWDNKATNYICITLDQKTVDANDEMFSKYSINLDKFLIIRLTPTSYLFVFNKPDTAKKVYTKFAELIDINESMFHQHLSIQLNLVDYILTLNETMKSIVKIGITHDRRKRYIMPEASFELKSLV